MGLPVNLKTLAGVACLLLAVSSLSAETKRPELFGFSLPYPKTLPVFPKSLQQVHIGPLSYLPFTLQVSSSGKVTESRPDTVGDTSEIRRSREYLESLRFEPARRSGKKTEAVLPVVVRWRRGVPFPGISLPIDTSLGNVVHDLFADAYRLNGIEFARLIAFPPYSGSLKKRDSSLLYPYIVLEVSLDGGGALTGVHVARSTYASFNLQLESASLWARFAPARVAGLPVASKAFLVVAFHPALDYPLPTWDSSRLAEMPLLQKISVRLFPDTIGLMFPPVPRWRPGDTVTYAGPNLQLTDTSDYYFSVDTLGRVRVRPEDPIDKTVKKTQAGIRVLLGFYPAIAFDGRPRPFYGFATMYMDYSTEIRIRYHWWRFR
jgi:hypothetical protein